MWAVLCLCDVTLFYDAALAQSYVKHFVNINIFLVFAQMTSLFSCVYQNGRHSRISFGFHLVFTLLILFSVRFSMEALRKCKNKDHTCLFQCINICCVSQKNFKPLVWWPQVQTTSSSQGKFQCMKKHVCSIYSILNNYM